MDVPQDPRTTKKETVRRIKGNLFYRKKAFNPFNIIQVLQDEIKIRLIRHEPNRKSKLNETFPRGILLFVQLVNLFSRIHLEEVQ